MSKKYYYIISILIILSFISIGLLKVSEKPVSETYVDTVYTLEGKSVGLSKELTYFGNAVHADLNDDGRQDIAFLATYSPGGSGTFYYVFAALDTPTGPVGSEGLFLGDRIAPQTTEIRTGADSKPQVVVNYADRKQGESFVVAPSVAKSLFLKFDPKTGQFGEVVADFTGEANPATMSLSMKPWTWVKATYADGKTIEPVKKTAFILTFMAADRFSARTDCNGVGGQYTNTPGAMKLSFKDMMSTQMYCEGSQEQEFTRLLAETASYSFTGKGELILSLTPSGSSMVFK